MANKDRGLDGVTFEEVQQMEHHEIAKKMQATLIYLSCGHPERFGLPLAEAIACGCLVVGYHGF